MKSLLNVGFILSAQDRMSTVINSAVSQANTKFSRLHRSMSMMNSVSNKSIMAGLAIVAPMIQMAEAAEKAENANKGLEGVMSHMWKGNKQAMQATKGMEDYASSLAGKIGKSGSEIKQVESNLATFQNVSSKSFVKSGLFNRATAAAYDIATVKGGDAISMANMLGKALNDPLNMVQALKKSGTVDTKDIAAIKKISIEHGRHAAQLALMAAVERQYKGAAERNATVIGKLTERFNNLKVTIGKSLLPMFNTYGNKLIDLANKASSFAKTHSGTTKTIIKVGLSLIGLGIGIRGVTMLMYPFIVAVKIYSTVTAFNTKYMVLAKIQTYALAFAQKTLTMGQWLLNAAFVASPIGWIVLGVAALTAGVIYCYKHFEGFRKVVDTVWTGMKKFGTIIKDYVINRITTLIKGIGLVGSAMGNLFSGNFKQAFKDGIQAVNYIENPFANANASSNIPKPVNMKPLTRNVAKNKSLSANTNITAPLTVNINGNADKSNIKAALQQHKNVIIGIIDKHQKNKLRLSY